MATFGQLLEAAMRAHPSPPAPPAATERAVRACLDGLAAAELGEALGSADDPVDVARDRTEAKRAFRRRVLETHPDRPGGSHAAFLETMATFGAAMDRLAS